MSEKYTLGWLDKIISISLNPMKADIYAIPIEEILKLEDMVKIEKSEQHLFINKLAFDLLNEQEIELLIKQYHSTLCFLLDQAFANHQHILPCKTDMNRLSNLVIDSLNELIAFIESRFKNYIDLYEKVPIISLIAFQKSVKKDLVKLKMKYKNIQTDHLFNSIWHYVNSFNKPAVDNSSISLNQLYYIKELIAELELLNPLEIKPVIFNSLDKLLIYLNFNDELFFNYITEKISLEVNQLEKLTDKLNYLLFRLKEFNQLYRKPRIGLRNELPDLKVTMDEWFSQEILYLEKIVQHSIIPLQPVKPLSKPEPISIADKSKVLCVLSTDQTGLILRASDELRILKARSMNQVFKTIVPYLSTDHKEHLSYDSMRSKSYSAEERDKKIVIDTLVQIIEKVKRY